MEEKLQKYLGLFLSKFKTYLGMMALLMMMMMEIHLVTPLDFTKFKLLAMASAKV